MRQSAGFVLILTLLVMVVVAILAFGTAFTTILDRQVSANQQGATEAYYIAQSGLQQYKTLMFRSLVNYYASNPSAQWCESPIEGGITNPDGSVLLASGSTTAWTAFGDGEYRIAYNSNSGYVILTSEGRIGNARATVQLVATSGGGPAGSWDNAIFATGQMPGTKAINGNVAVYGSVHIVQGELELETDLSLTGTAGVYNNYNGKDGEANSFIGEPMGRIVQGSTYSTVGSMPDLCAKVKIERGDLVLESGAARAGTQSSPIYSIHIGQGNIYGNKNKSSGSIISNHHTSNSINLKYPTGAGVNSGYEGHEVPFPVLPANYPNDRGMTVTAAACPWLFSSGVVRLPPAAAGTCTDGTNTITWDGAKLTIDGTINTGTASLNIVGPLFYQGMGVLRTGSCLDVPDPDAISCINPDPLVTVSITGTVEPLGAGYPETNALGIVSSGDVFISNKPGNPDKQVAAMMVYSAGEVTLDKQTLVAGAVVGTAFDVGNQVPKIAYHPAIRDVSGLLCLPGAYDLAAGCIDGSGPIGVGGSPGSSRQPLSDVSYERR